MIAVSMLAAMVFNYLKINSMQALYWTAILHGLLAPPLLALIMFISSNDKVMGDRRNSRPLNVLGWITTAAMTVACVLLLWSMFTAKH